MSLQLRYPNINGKTPEERQQQMERHLRSMIDQMNLFLKKTGETENNSQTGNFEEALNSKVSKTEKEFAKQMKAYWDKQHPVGSIYLSVSDTNPSTLFGGTWERIEDTFLLAAGSSYAAGETGGEATHTLTVNEMPSHSHNIKTIEKKVASGSNYSRIASDGTGVDSVIVATGGSKAHNNMPPYLAVYVWKRIE